VNRFFRSALFPLVIIAALVWLALQTLSGHGAKTEKITYSQAIQQIEACDAQTCGIDEVVFNPNKQELKLTYKGEEKKTATVHYPSDQSVPGLQSTT
jgi:ATP-dependent Zn protease